MDAISFIINVIPRTKKNSSRIVKMGSRLALLPSKQYKEFEEECIYKIEIKAGVIKDDNRNVVASHDGSLVLYDKERPRIEIEIKPLFGYNIW